MASVLGWWPRRAARAQEREADMDIKGEKDVAPSSRSGLARHFEPSARWWALWAGLCRGPGFNM